MAASKAAASADRCGQGVANPMGDRSHNLSNGCHAFGFQELGLHRPQFLIYDSQLLTPLLRA